ncbi:Gfo/Idh/MocA family protein [Rhodococcus qingshengii]|uniref:Gfo/Idh/MocA family protein n=1 Tax=Rhodococcus qingshengii TaxID=334542 RepID=UPI0036D88305
MKSVDPSHSDAPVRFAVLGCADIAWRKTLPALEADPGATVVAVASRDLERARAMTDRFGGTPVQGYDAVAERDDVDAVYIPLPALLHAEWIERMLLAGKHVLVEKPMTANLADTRRLLDMARTHGLVVLENYMFLHHSQHAAVRKTISDGAIGEVRGFASTFTIPPKPAGDIRYCPDTGGGAFLDFGGYPVRAAVHFLGEDLDVVGAVLRRDRDSGVVLSGFGVLSTPDGVPASFRFGMEHSYRNHYEFVGSFGRLELNRVFTPPESWCPELRLERQDHREFVDLPPDNQFANVVAYFVDRVRGRPDDQSDDRATLAQAWLIEQIYEKARVVTV